MPLKLKPTVRKEQILTAAVAQAAKLGYQNVTREAVANAAECAPATVSLYFNTMAQLKRAVMRAAIHTRVLPVVAQGIALGDPQAKKAPDELKAAALASLK